MANPEHLKILKQGVEAWNKWREENPEVRPDLSEIKFSETSVFWFLKNVRGAEPGSLKIDFSNAILEKADFSNAFLPEADFSGANLSEANFFKASLPWANFSKANLFKAEFLGADLLSTNFSDANLYGVNLPMTRLIDTNFSHAKLEKANIYGISAWNIKKSGFFQKDLIITRKGEPEITVDDLEVAQFIYLMLNNERIKHVIEEITSKAVLILGRFTPERKAVLDALKDELRRRNYLPIVFDFENAGSKSLNETMSLLARMSRFIVADITDAKAVREELALVIPQNPSIPVIPLVLKGEEVYSTFDFPKLFKSVLDLHEYDSPEILLENIIPAIIAPAEQKVAELRGK